MNDYRTFLTRWRLPLFFFLLANFMGSVNANTAVNKTWSEPTALANTAFDFDGITSSISEYYGRGLKIITNNNDKAFAVWKQHDSIASVDTSYHTDRIIIKYALWSAYFDGEKWSSPMKIKGNTPRERATIPEIIFDSNGDILAAWTESIRSGSYSFSLPMVFVSRFDSHNLDWDNPTQLTYDNAHTITNLKITSRNNGIIHLTWEQYITDSYSQWSSVFNGSSWNNPTQLHESLTLESYSTKVNPILSPYKNDMMSMYQADSFDVPDGFNAVFANHFNGNNWSTPQRLSSDTTLFVSDQKMAFDNNGNAIVVWRDIQTEQEGYALNILVSHFNRSSRSWSAPVSINQDEEGGYPELAVNDNGNAIVVWERGSEILASYFNGSNWSTPSPIPSASGGILKVAFDSNSHAHVAWTEAIDGNSVHFWINHFDGNRWGSATSMETSTKYVNIETPLKKHVERPMMSLNIAIGGDGNAHALWDHTVTTWVREGPSTLFPWKETKTKTIWTSQFKITQPISITQAVIYKPYGSLVILIGENFMELDGASPNDGSSGFNLVDQNGNAPIEFYVWEDNLIGALFAEDPETVTITNPSQSKVTPLVNYY